MDLTRRGIHPERRSGQGIMGATHVPLGRGLSVLLDCHSCLRLEGILKNPLPGIFQVGTQTTRFLNSQSLTATEDGGAFLARISHQGGWRHRLFPSRSINCRYRSHGVLAATLSHRPGGFSLALAWPKLNP